MMLEFVNARGDTPSCSLCSCSVISENYTPKGCTHVFHPKCFDDWKLLKESSDELFCPADGCSVKFTEVHVRKIPFGPTTKIMPVGESPQCPICCEVLQHPIATPESCNHAFCFVCLREWSRFRHECPLDRGAFELILLSDFVGGPIVKRVTAPPVESHALEEPFEEIDTVCEICTSADDEAHLLLCDQCDRGYHTYCLPVPLSSIPPGDWFCPDCVRHGAGQASEDVDSSLSTTVRRRRRRQSSASLLADNEAIESDRSDSDDNNDNSLEDDEDFAGMHRISAATQRLLRQRANSRYRGSRLLQDTIVRLAERVLNEATTRVRRRRNQIQRVRRQLASEQRGQTRLTTTENSNQRLLCLQPQTEQANGPTQLDDSNPAITQTRSRRSQSNSASVEQSDVESRSQGRRRRLLVLSDSCSESDEENGIQLSMPSLRRDRVRRFPTDTDESDAERDPPKRARFNTSTTTTRSDSPRPSTSEAPPEPSTSLTSPSSPLSTSPTVRLKKRKSKKVKRTKIKKHKTGKTLRRSKRRKSKRRTLTATQKKIKKRIRKSSSSNNSSNVSSSFNHSTSKPSSSSYRLPRLSVFGSEPTCSLFVEDTEPEAVTEQAQNPEPSTSSTFRPAKVNLLSEIVDGQKSLFSFTTRHMNVNPDHSMSPIPVAKQQNGIASHSHVYDSPNVKITLPLKCPVQCPSNGKENGDPSRRLFNGILKTSNATKASTSTQQSPESAWTEERLRRAKSVLKSCLKPQVAAGTIDREAYRRIFERAVIKIKQKDVSKVTDARIAKLAKDYIDYHLNHPLSSQGS